MRSNRLPAMQQLLQLLLLLLLLPAIALASLAPAPVHDLFWTHLQPTHPELLPPSCSGTATVIDSSTILKYGAVNLEAAGTMYVSGNNLTKLSLTQNAATITNSYDWEVVAVQAGAPPPRIAQAMRYS